MAGPCRTVGVVLAGCGHLDGAEIQEATLSLYFLDRAGARVLVFAPDRDQAEVIDHRDGEAATGLRRNMLAEAARIARCGGVRALASADPSELDAVVFPGGCGVAKNLCTYDAKGRAMEVLPEVETLVSAVHRAGKPAGFICIAPVIAAKVLGAHRPRLTIGSDPETAADLESFGAVHVVCRVDETVVDEKNRLVSTPAYMLGPSVAAIATGIERLVRQVLELA